MTDSVLRIAACTSSNSRRSSFMLPAIACTDPENLFDMSMSDFSGAAGAILPAATAPFTPLLAPTPL